MLQHPLICVKPNGFVQCPLLKKPHLTFKSTLKLAQDQEMAEQGALLQLQQ